MVERGSRYIITTTDNIYVSPSVKILKEQGKVLFPVTSISNGFDVLEAKLTEVVSIFKENYEKSDVTEELIPLEDNILTLV